MRKILISLLCSMMVFASVTTVQAAASREELDAIIQQANSLDEEKYSDESYRVLEDKVSAGVSLGTDATQYEVDEAVNAIEEAIDDLVVKYPNLALNKEVTASSTYPRTKFAVANATDGNNKTRWGNYYESTEYINGNHEETITVNLGAKYSIDMVTIMWEEAHATNYTIQGSNNGTDFFNIKEVTNGAGNTETHKELGNVQLQYVRLALHEASGEFGYSIYEIEVYGKDPHATVYNNIAINKDVTASSSYAGDKFKYTNINDGSMDTRWGSNYTKGVSKEETVIVDLGSTYVVDRVVITFENAYAKTYKVQASTDGETYEDITGTLTGSVGEQRLVNLNRNARYIKLVLLEAATDYGYSIYELEVYSPRENDLEAVLDELEEKLEDVEVGTTEGKMAQEDYNRYEKIVNDAQALIDDDNRKNADIIAAIEAINEALLTVDGDVIKGEASVSIYPTPQDITINSNNGMKFNGTVDIVVHGEQDEATLPKLEQLLQEHGIEYKYADAVGVNPAVVLAINDNCSICTSVEDKANALDHVQGYVLESSNDENKKGQVTIVGNDADGVYYGVMSLLQMFKQKTSDGRIAEVTISDYPDVEFRGYVEGFYGIPWTFDDRKELFEDTTLYKMTTYIYAPKDDPYHRKDWRKLYPESEANNIKDLAEVAKENNMEFCWTIHPGADYDYTTDADSDGLVDDYEAILAKFEQVYSLGVRQFGVFYDDLKYAVADGIQHATVINNAYEYLTNKYNDVKPFITVVTRYTNSWGAPWNTYFTPFMENIHPDTIVLWTGQDTMSAITKAYMEVPKTKTGVDRDLGVWWNYPVNDYSKGNLFMGALDCLSNDVDNIVSFFLNPMPQADASKVAIYSGADYSWNIGDFNSEESWKRAIDELVPEADEEFERFADNVSYVTKGNGFFFDESVYLIEEFEDFKEALSDGLTKDDVKELKDRFEQIISDVATLRTINDAALLEEIEQHLNLYEAVGEAGLATMQAFEAALEGDINTVVEKMDEYEVAIDESGKFRIKILNGSIIAAGCTYRIKPFLSDIQDSIMAVLNDHVDYSIEERMLSNVLGIGKQDVDYAKKVYSLSDISVTMDKDEYVGIALPKVVNIYDIKADVTPANHFKLQYSLNGIDWNDIEYDNDNDTLVTEDIVTGAYVRLVCTVDNTEATIEKLSVSQAYEPIFATVSTDMPVYKTNIPSQALDGSLTTCFWSSDGSKEGNYIKVDLGDAAILNTVELYSGISRGAVDGYAATQLEVSKDGVVWIKVGSPKELSEYQNVDSTTKKLVFDANGAEGRYFRFVAVEASESWAKVCEIKYDAEYTDYENRLALSTNTSIYKDNIIPNAWDNDLNTYAWIKNINYKKKGDPGICIGDYVQADLGTIVPLYDASIYFGKNTNQPELIADGFKAVKLQTSLDGETWSDASAVLNMEDFVASGNYYIATLKSDGRLVRYIRFVATEDYGSWAKVYEIKYNPSLNLNNNSGAVTTDMKTYQSHNIGNAMDKNMSSKFYSSAASEKGNYIQVDFGVSGTLYDASIYFGGDPKNAASVDGFAEMDIQVSNDANEWTTVKSMAKSEYKVVGGKYLATADLGGVTGRYVRFTATEGSSNWVQVYEIQFNNTVDTNAVRFVDGVGSVNVNRTNYLDDGKLQTSANIYEVDNGDTLIYPTNTITNVTTVGILQDISLISNATVSVQALDGEWSDIGTLDKAWNEFNVNKHILAVKLTFDGTTQPMIYDILIEGLANYSRVYEAIASKPTDLEPYTQESVDALNQAINAVVENKELSEQLVVDGYATAILNAIDALDYKDADYSAVEAAKGNIPADLSIYTDETVKALQDAVAAVVEGKKITEQSVVDGYAGAIEAAIIRLAYKDADYASVNAAKGNIPSDLSLYTDETAQAVRDAVAAVVEGKKITEQTTVDGYAAAINSAVGNLKYKDADYASVNAAKGNIPADLSIYTDETVKALQNAVAAVVEGKKITEQAEVDAMAEAIEEAVEALKYKPADYSKVEEAKDKIPEELSNYTEESVHALNEVLMEIDSRLDITQQSVVDGYVTAINEAVDALVLKDADYTKVEEALDKIPEDLSKYTDETVKALKDAVEAVKEDLDITKQEEVNAYAKAIEDAIAGLKEKVTVEPVEPDDDKDKPVVDDKPTDTDKPTKTGDNSPVGMYVLAGFVSLIGFIYLKRKREEA